MTTFSVFFFILFLYNFWLRFQWCSVLSKISFEKTKISKSNQRHSIKKNTAQAVVFRNRYKQPAELIPPTRPIQGPKMLYILYTSSKPSPKMEFYLKIPFFSKKEFAFFSKNGILLKDSLHKSIKFTKFKFFLFYQFSCS